MKWVVVSDNHSMKNILTDIVSIHDDADVYIHLGDSEFDYRDVELKDYIKIRGNCDYSKDFHDTYELQQNDINAFLTHGHLYQVGHGRTRLAHAASDVNCQLALYGHLHVKRVEVIDGVVCINPGSIAQSRSDEEETYAVLTFDESDKMVTFYNQRHEIVGKEILIF
ncbi:YfcE family phosphodiesterase [Macrococcus capreoli]